MNHDIDAQTLQAYVDGELAPDARTRVEAAIAADPALAAQVERERRLRARLRAAFDPVLDEPVPAQLSALLDAHAADRPADAIAATPAADIAVPTADVVDLAARRPKRPAWVVPAYALAASVLVFAITLAWRPSLGPMRMQGDALIASGALARGLDSALASAPDAESAVAVGLSFRDADGRVCRSFVHRATPALAGLACRDGARWTLPVVSRPDATAAGEVRPASSAMPPEVQAAIDARLQGEVFDAAQERAARDAGWR